MRQREDRLHGRIVLSGDGVVLGEITKLLVDDASWRVEAIQVRLRRDTAERLGATHGRFRSATIDIATHFIQSVGDAVILAVPLDGLRSPPPAQPSESVPLY